MDDDYETGYGKPPKEHRFKPGKSGNPKGRPRKKVLSLADIIDEELELPRELANGDRVTMQRMVVRGMLARAAKGDIKVAEWLFTRRAKEMGALFPEDRPIEVTMVFEEEDRRRAEILAANERFRKLNEDDDPEDGCGGPAEPPRNPRPLPSGASVADQSA